MYLLRGWKAFPRSLVFDERTLRVGLRGFGVYVALALHTDDAGTLRCDPKQLTLIVGGDRRALRKHLPRLIEAGLIHPFVAPVNRRPGQYAPEQTGEFHSWFAGCSSDGRWLSFLWFPDVAVKSLSRLSRVVLTSPVCPRSWLVKAGLADFFEKLIQKFVPDPETEPEANLPPSSPPQRGVSV